MRRETATKPQPAATAPHGAAATHTHTMTYEAPPAGLEPAANGSGKSPESGQVATGQQLSGSDAGASSPVRAEIVAANRNQTATGHPAPPARLTDAEAAAIAGRWATDQHDPLDVMLSDLLPGNVAEQEDVIRSDVAALLADRAALVAEVERLRDALDEAQTPDVFGMMHGDGSYADVDDMGIEDSDGPVEIWQNRDLGRAWAVHIYDDEHDGHGRTVLCPTRAEAERVADAARGAA